MSNGESFEIKKYVNRYGTRHNQKENTKKFYTANPQLYIRENVPISELTDNEIRIGLCFKSGKNVNICFKCPVPCTFGKEAMRRETAEGIKNNQKTPNEKESVKKNE